MPHETVFVTLHIHTDGPIPGPHSLLTLSSAAHRGDGGLITTFTTNLRELPGATLHPVVTRAVADAGGRLAQHPPGAHDRPPSRPAPTSSGSEKLPGRPTLVTDPVGPDHLFVYWYLHRFAGLWPFARTSMEATALIAASPLPAERMPTGTGPHQLTTPRRPVRSSTGRRGVPGDVPPPRELSI